jgi:hypothetical protein
MLLRYHLLVLRANEIIIDRTLYLIKLRFDISDSLLKFSWNA